jgi:hypothetical protein
MLKSSKHMQKVRIFYYPFISVCETDPLKGEKYLTICITIKYTSYQPNECLDWQSSQFINIVGKDDIAGSRASGERAGFAAFLAFCAGPHTFLPSHSEFLTRAPTLG